MPKDWIFLSERSANTSHFHFRCQRTDPQIDIFLVSSLQSFYRIPKLEFGCISFYMPTKPADWLCNVTQVDGTPRCLHKLHSIASCMGMIKVTSPKLLSETHSAKPIRRSQIESASCFQTALFPFTNCRFHFCWVQPQRVRMDPSWEGFSCWYYEFLSVTPVSRISFLPETPNSAAEFSWQLSYLLVFLSGRI